jgi:hypothetical protein
MGNSQHLGIVRASLFTSQGLVDVTFLKTTPPRLWQMQNSGIFFVLVYEACQNKLASNMKEASSIPQIA